MSGAGSGRVAEIESAIADQEAAGVDVVTDGQADAGATFSSYLSAFDGIVAGEVAETGATRWVRPIVSAPIRYRRRTLSDGLRAMAGAHVARKMVLPGAYSLAKLARIEGRAYANSDALAWAFAEQGAVVTAELAAAGAAFIQIEEPGVSSTADFRLLRRLCEPLWEARGAATLIVSIGGVGAEDAYAQLNSVAADCLALDVAASPQLLRIIEATGAGIPLALGACDGRRIELESAVSLAHSLEAVFHRYQFGELHLQPSCGLAALPRPAARAKLELMGQVRRLLSVGRQARASAQELDA